MVLCFVYKDNQLILRKLLQLNTDYTLGQSRNCDIHLDYPTVSRKHAQLSVIQPKSTLANKTCELWFTDLGSRNGTKQIKNSEHNILLTAHSKVNLNFEDHIHIGPFKIVFLLADKKHLSAAKAQLASKLHKKLNDKTLGYKAATAPDLFPLALTLAENLPLSENDLRELCLKIYSERHEHGPIGPYLNDPNCREILVNAPDSIFVDVGEGLVALDEQFSDMNALTAWTRRLASLAKVRLDPNAPLAEGVLADGARLQFALHPIAASGACVAIRRFPMRCPDEYAALHTGWLEERSLSVIKNLVSTRKNILVSGGTSAGKTTLLNFIAAYIKPKDRLVTIEDIFELQLNHPNVARLQCRSTNTEGAGEITIRHLVRSALRMRPDRLILGECRGKEAFDLMQAMNTGHPGSMATIHANNARAALSRLSTLTLMADAGLGAPLAQELCTQAIDAVIHTSRNERGERRIEEIIIRSSERSEQAYETIYSSN